MEWYEYLFKHLDAAKDDFGKIALSIVTFNYDRSLEHFLMMSIQNSYGLDSNEAFELSKKIPIVHLYGSLGAYTNAPGAGRMYSHKLDPAEIQKAASSLKIMSEGTDDSDEFRQAHEFFRGAQKVAVIGFGYHEANVRRLDIARYCRTDQVYGTAYGLGENEKRIATTRMGGDDKIRLAPKEMDALSFLQCMPVDVLRHALCLPLAPTTRIISLS